MYCQLNAYIYNTFTLNVYTNTDLLHKTQTLKFLMKNALKYECSAMKYISNDYRTFCLTFFLIIHLIFVLSYFRETIKYNLLTTIHLVCFYVHYFENCKQPSTATLLSFYWLCTRNTNDFVFDILNRQYILN